MTQYTLSPKMYDKLKFFVITILPALSTLYFVLSGLWGLPYTTQIVGTCAALATFLGAIIGLSAKSFNADGKNFDGIMTVGSTPDKLNYELTFNGDPYDIQDLKEVRFKVIPEATLAE